MPMIMHFNCTETGRSFETADYALSENRGVRTNSEGEKILEAVVVLKSPCPHCGRIHSYMADTLACPFTAE